MVFLKCIAFFTFLFDTSFFHHLLLSERILPEKCLQVEIYMLNEWSKSSCSLSYAQLNVLKIIDKLNNYYCSFNYAYLEKKLKIIYSMQRNHRFSSVTSDNIPVVQVVKAERWRAWPSPLNSSSSTGIVTC